jgi:hypothetical protein
MFISSDPNDASSEVGLGPLRRVDLRQHQLDRYGRIPFLDASKPDTSGNITRVQMCLGGGPLMDRRVNFSAADELTHGRAQIDEDQVAWGKRVSVPLVSLDAPQPGPEKPGSLFAQP